jgi:DNA-binding response OmpR family regulator
VAVDGAELDQGGAVHEGHELIVLPLRAAELRARIARARRRVNGVPDDNVVRVGTLEVNLATYQVAVGGAPVDFTYMEYELLKFLVTHPGRVFSREALLSRVWGFDYYGGARTVDVHVRRVRAKLGAEHAGRIKTVRSVGYRFEGEPR